MGVTTITHNNIGLSVFVRMELYDRMNRFMMKWMDPDCDNARAMKLDPVPVSLDMIDHYRGLRDLLNQVIDAADRAEAVRDLPDGRRMDDGEL